MLTPLKGSGAVIVPRSVRHSRTFSPSRHSVGVLFHLWRRLPYHNAIWHGFVLMGAACHYMAILDEMAREVL
jgi:hypothetical protein